MRFILLFIFTLGVLGLQAQKDTTCMVTISVMDTATGSPLEVSLKIYNYSLENNDSIIYQDTNSELNLSLIMRTNFGVSTYLSGYHFESTSFTTGKAGTPLQVNIYLAKIDEAIFRTLPDIHFGPYDYGIPEDSATNHHITSIIELLQNDMELKLVIEGHVTSQEHKAQPRLSILRAHAIYALLLETGIDRKRISYSGKEDQHPIFAGNPNQKAKLSRRVVFTIERN
ncbi:MAG: OmpA family protein [Flavobacteriales bacterium]|nr:OmpA family protein [Flavobacteriales bacterium]